MGRSDLSSFPASSPSLHASARVNFLTKEFQVMLREKCTTHPGRNDSTNSPFLKFAITKDAFLKDNCFFFVRKFLQRAAAITYSAKYDRATVLVGSVYFLSTGGFTRRIMVDG